MQELQQWQHLPLSIKVSMTKDRVRQWVNTYGEDGVYVSFSGGKDSTVLMDIVRNKCGYDKVVGVFVDTGLEFPEIREFVRSYENVTWLRPKMSFKQVVERYGFPFISKEVTENVAGAKKYLKVLLKDSDCKTLEELLNNREKLAEMLNDRMINRKGGSNQRLACLLGMRTRMNDNPVKAYPSESEKSTFLQEKYKFFLEAPFDISPMCCNVMKKDPVHNYYRQTHKCPITAQMASESRLRTQKWLENGCNGFHLSIPTSNPMAFWTEQDVLMYIKENDIRICSVYGEIVEDTSNTDDIAGQLSFSDIDGWEDYEVSEKITLKTTGCPRTGCMLCGFGCHLKEVGKSRFETLNKTHPKVHKALDVVQNNGYTMKQAIDWINEHGELNIRY